MLSFFSHFCSTLKFVISTFEDFWKYRTGLLFHGKNSRRMDGVRNAHR